MLVTAPFAVDRTGNGQASADQGVDKKRGACMCVVCATHTMEYHPTFKEETLPLATTQMSLESTMLSEFARRTANACRIPPRRTR